MDKLKEMLAAMIESALNGFDSGVASAQEILSGSSFDGSGVWGRALAISDTLKPFCYTVIGICLMVELAQTAAKVDMIKWEHGLKAAVKMVLAKECIDIAPTFLRACYNQAGMWIGALAGSYSPMGASLMPLIRNQIDSITGFWSVIGLMMTCLVVAMAVKICGMMVQVMAFGRMFEIYAYLAVSPVPCAFLPLGEGGRQLQQDNDEVLQELHGGLPPGGDDARMHHGIQRGRGKFV